LIDQKKRRRKSCSIDFSTYDELVAEPGDLIEFKRKFIVHGIYSHWAVYIEDNKVIHLGVHKERGVQIRREELKQVAKGDQCRVNNLEEAAKNLDSNLELKPKLETEQNALKYLNEFKKGNLTCCLTNFNCEHFVTLCAYGKPFSEQVDNVMDTELQPFGLLGRKSAFLSFGHPKAQSFGITTWFSLLKY